MTDERRCPKCGSTLVQVPEMDVEEAKDFGADVPVCPECDEIVPPPTEPCSSCGEVVPTERYKVVTQTWQGPDERVERLCEGCVRAARAGGDDGDVLEVRGPLYRVVVVEQDEEGTWVPQGTMEEPDELALLDHPVEEEPVAVEVEGETIRGAVLHCAWAIGGGWDDAYLLVESPERLVVSGADGGVGYLMTREEAEAEVVTTIENEYRNRRLGRVETIYGREIGVRIDVRLGQAT